MTVVEFKDAVKTCSKCGENKPFSAYHKHSDGGFQPQCKTYRKVAAARPGPDKRKNVIETDTGRNCLACGEIKSWDQFAKDVHGYKQKTATCKIYRNEKFRKIYKENPNVQRSTIKDKPHVLKKRYGVTYGQVVQTLANQLGRCANHGCGKEIFLNVVKCDESRAVIDHDHKTGKFRAMLCGKCNLDLGMIECNETRFLGLMDYKTKHYQN